MTHRQKGKSNTTAAAITTTTTTTNTTTKNNNKNNKNNNNLQSQWPKREGSCVVTAEEPGMGAGVVQGRRTC